MKRWTKRPLRGVGGAALLGMLATFGLGAGVVRSADDGARLTVSSSAIDGQVGHMLIVLAVPADGGGASGRLCVPIPSSPFRLPPTEITDPPVPWNPCGPATPVTALAKGTYRVRAMVNRIDEYAPIVSYDEELVVDGATVVELDGAKLSAARPASLPTEVPPRPAPAPIERPRRGAPRDSGAPAGG